MTSTARATTVHRLVRADRLRVFDAFAGADAQTQWFIPDAGISLEVVDFDFVPHGRFRGH